MLEERAKQLWHAHLDAYDAESLNELTDDDKEQAFLDARRWACGTVGGAAALLTRTKHGFIADDYVVAQCANERMPIPLPIWRDALTDAQQQPQASFTILDLAYRAAVAGVPEIAKQVWEPLAAGDADDAPEAAVNLGVLLSQLGDWEGARAAYQQAIDSGHTDVTQLAAANLRVLLEETDSQEARVTFTQGPNWVRVHVRAVPGAVSSPVVEVVEPRTGGSSPTHVVRLESHADSGLQVPEEEVSR
jgi:tetratricopeptide (TPR) repeat protein